MEHYEKIKNMTLAVYEAEQLLTAVDNQAARMAKLLIGRLRRIKYDSNTLCELKKELKDYNMHTGEWK